MKIIKRRPIDLIVEKQIITALIISTPFIKRFAPIYKPELFQSEFSKIVSKWCMDYYKSYEQAPSSTIQDIYRVKSETIDPVEAEGIAKFLSTLSDQYDKDATFNIEYILDKSVAYIQHRNLSNLVTRISGELANNNLLLAESAVANYLKVNKGVSQEIDLFHQTDWIDKMFDEEKQDFLFSVRGNLGKLIPPFYRETLVAIVAPEKRGKSWWLMDFALTAVCQGCNVGYFNFEMREDQLNRRFAQNMLSAPGISKYETLQIPAFDCVHNQNDTCTKSERISDCCSVCNGTDDFQYAVKHTEKTRPIITKEAVEKQIKQQQLFTRGKTIRIQTRPSNTYTVEDIESQLDIWESEGFITDLVVLDYADLLMAKSSIKDYRHGLDDIWSSLKRIAQKRKICFLTATQASKEAYDKRIKQGGLSEDKRKAAHAERVIALNQVTGDKASGIMRINILFDREEDSQSWKEAVVLQALGWGRPYLDATIIKKEE